MSRLLTELLEMIPSDTEERVERTKDRLNQPLRDALRQEMGVVLNRQELDSRTAARGAGRESAAVRIKLIPGYPVSIRERELSEEQRLSALLGPWLPTLVQVRDNVGYLRDLLVPWLERDRDGRKFTGDDEAFALAETSAFVEQLIRTAQQVSVVQWILEVNEDILGVYRWGQSSWRPAQQSLFEDADDVREGHVELYWGVIGLIARALAVSVEDLTAVVLAHELAHAYSHLGTDIDGRRWRTGRFATGQRELKEGIAQHYALAACRRIARFAPDCEKVYRVLLKYQPAPYRVQEKWEREYSKEAIRLALLETRRNGHLGLDSFVDAMERAEKQLGRRL